MVELSLWALALGEHCDSHGEGIWGFFVYPFIMLYIFYLLAQICDGHLNLALEFIVDRMKLSEDVAGATFLAMASSAPELFCSMVSTFVLVSASGVGNIVGSAVFNLLVIIGVTPVFAGSTLKIWWYPTARDSAFYASAILEIFVVMQDGKVYWWEGLIMTLSYAGYVFYFTQNQRICKYLGLESPFQDEPRGSAPSCPSPDSPAEDAVKIQAGTGETEEIESVQQDMESGKESPDVRRSNKRCKTSEDSRSSSHDLVVSQGAGSERDQSKERTSSKDLIANNFTLKGKRTKELNMSKVMPEPSSPGDSERSDSIEPAEKAPSEKESVKEKEEARFLKYEPMMMIIDATMPTKPERLYTLFCLCCLWIGGFTYFAVDAAGRIGCLVNMPDVVMGLVFLAAGTSVPDAMGSISVARDGMGDMAVANAVGSNTFDILLGLGLPWFLKGLASGEPVLVPTDKLQEAILILAGCLAFYLFAITMNKWELTRNLGFALLALYACVITWILVRSFVEF